MLLMWGRSAQDKFCYMIMSEGMQTPCHHALTFVFTFAFIQGCIRGAWKGGHHSSPKQGLGSCCSARGAGVAGAEE